MNLFDYIKQEEANYKTSKVTVTDGYEWSMYEHIRQSTLYRDSKFVEGPNDNSRPFKNIIRRIINFQHYATGFDVKDIEPFVNDSKNYHKSFLARKFHPKWARKHDIDTAIDESTESYVDFGLTLMKHANGIAPLSVPLQSIAFCDQTDILSGPICLRHEYSPAQLQEYKGKWKNIDEVITLARKEKTTPSGVVIKTPGKFIEAYELDGVFPKIWETDPHADANADEDTTYTQQFHMVTYYQDEKGSRVGISLFSGKGDPKKYKAKKRDPIFGRACGFGAIEEITPDQIWTNYNQIRLQEMLDIGSKVIFQTADPGFAARNDVRNADNGAIWTHAENKPATLLNNGTPNIQLFERANQDWEVHAQGLASANDAVLGESPTSGTPFKLQELVTYQGKGPHEYRQSQLATFWGEIYRDWVLKDLVEEMNNEQEFLEELDLEELEYVADKIVDCASYEKIKEMILNGETITDEMVEEHKQEVRQEFMKGGSKRFFKVLKNELKGLPVDVEVNIAGKQKNLAAVADKLGNVWRQIFSNPQGFVQVMQIPGASKAFNDMLEASGLSPMNFAAMKPELVQSMQPAVPQEEPQALPVAQ